jgi:hypothetical protein
MIRREMCSCCTTGSDTVVLCVRQLNTSWEADKVDSLLVSCPQFLVEHSIGDTVTPPDDPGARLAAALYRN